MVFEPSDRLANVGHDWASSDQRDAPVNGMVDPNFSPSAKVYILALMATRFRQAVPVGDGALCPRYNQATQNQGDESND